MPYDFSNLISMLNTVIGVLGTIFGLAVMFTNYNQTMITNSLNERFAALGKEASIYEMDAEKLEEYHTRFNRINMLLNQYKVERLKFINMCKEQQERRILCERISYIILAFIIIDFVLALADKTVSIYVAGGIISLIILLFIHQLLFSVLDILMPSNESLENYPSVNYLTNPKFNVTRDDLAIPDYFTSTMFAMLHMLYITSTEDKNTIYYSTYLRKTDHRKTDKSFITINIAYEMKFDSVLEISGVNGEQEYFKINNDMVDYYNHGYGIVLLVSSIPVEEIIEIHMEFKNDGRDKTYLSYIKSKTDRNLLIPYWSGANYKSIPINYFQKRFYRCIEENPFE